MQASRDSREAQRLSAFTLLEVLVGTVILGMMLLLLGQVTSQVSQSWIAGRGGAQYRKNAQALADYIGVELAQAIVPVNDHNVADGSNLQFLLNPPLSSVPAQYRNADALFWQAPVATETSLGDAAILGYYVQWQGGVPYLCRLFINPSIVNVDGKVDQNPYYRIYTASSSGGWLGADLLENLVRPHDPAAGFRGLMAENVLGFWVRCYGADGVELPKSYDSHVGYECEFQTGLNAADVVTMKRRLPASVEISLAQLESGYFGRLKGAEAAVKGLTSRSNIVDAHAFYTELEKAAAGDSALKAILPGVRIYTKKIQIESRR